MRRTKRRLSQVDGHAPRTSPYLGASRAALRGISPNRKRARLDAAATACHNHRNQGADVQGPQEEAAVAMDPRLYEQILQELDGPRREGFLRVCAGFFGGSPAPTGMEVERPVQPERCGMHHSFPTSPGQSIRVAHGNDALTAEQRLPPPQRGTLKQRVGRGLEVRRGENTQRQKKRRQGAAQRARGLESAPGTTASPPTASSMSGVGGSTAASPTVAATDTDLVAPEIALHPAELSTQAPPFLRTAACVPPTASPRDMSASLANSPKSPVVGGAVISPRVLRSSTRKNALGEEEQARNAAVLRSKIEATKAKASIRLQQRQAETVAALRKKKLEDRQLANEKHELATEAAADLRRWIGVGLVALIRQFDTKARIAEGANDTDMINKAYKIALGRLHPDKQISKPLKEQVVSEEKYKLLQDAHDHWLATQ